MHRPRKKWESSTKKKGVMVIALGKDHAGKPFTIYSGRNSTNVKAVDSKGAYTFEVPDGNNYTLLSS